MMQACMNYLTPSG